MAPSVAASGESQQKPLVQQMKGVLGKLVRKSKTGDATSNNVFGGGPHWRRSVNVMIQSHGNVKIAAGTESRPIKSSTTSVREEQQTTCGFMQLPKEIRHLIEAYLPRVDVVCLRQTCQRLRYESNTDVEVQQLSLRQLYSLRKRLDRECFWLLCAMEERKELGNQLAVCSFCQNVHDRRSFAAIQLRLLPQERVCDAATKEYLICGNYRTTPSNLRLGLEEVLATGREDWKVHHWIPHTGPRRYPGDGHIMLSRAIEKDQRIPERRSTLMVSDTGLVVEHHFHLQSQSTLLPIGWNITSALGHPQKGIVPICAHHTIQSAGTKLGNRRLVDNQYSLSCRHAHCGTEFAFFECPGDAVGWKDLCFRVKRNFGWVENVCDGFWEAQERRTGRESSGYLS